MDSLLPSERARLVLGYLEEELCPQSYETFLQESKHLNECLTVTRQGRKFSTKVMGRTLKEILDEYCALLALVEEFSRTKSLSCKNVPSLTHIVRELFNSNEIAANENNGNNSNNNNNNLQSVNGNQQTLFFRINVQQHGSQTSEIATLNSNGGRCRTRSHNLERLSRNSSKRSERRSLSGSSIENHTNSPLEIVNNNKELADRDNEHITNQIVQSDNEPSSSQIVNNETEKCNNQGNVLEADIVRSITTIPTITTTTTTMTTTSSSTIDVHTKSLKTISSTCTSNSSQSNITNLSSFELPTTTIIKNISSNNNNSTISPNINNNNNDTTTSDYIEPKLLESIGLKPIETKELINSEIKHTCQQQSLKEKNSTSTSTSIKKLKRKHSNSPGKLATPMKRPNKDFEIFTNTLLKNHGFQDKIAESINRVLQDTNSVILPESSILSLNPSEIENDTILSTSTISTNNIFHEDAVKSIVEQTENDPAFADFLEQYINNLSEGLNSNNLQSSENINELSSSNNENENQHQLSIVDSNKKIPSSSSSSSELPIKQRLRNCKKKNYNFAKIGRKSKKTHKNVLTNKKLDDMNQLAIQEILNSSLKTKLPKTPAKEHTNHIPVPTISIASPSSSNPHTLSIVSTIDNHVILDSTPSKLFNNPPIQSAILSTYNNSNSLTCTIPTITTTNMNYIPQTPGPSSSLSSQLINQSPFDIDKFCLEKCQMEVKSYNQNDIIKPQESMKPATNQELTYQDIIVVGTTPTLYMAPLAKDFNKLIASSNNKSSPNIKINSSKLPLYSSTTTIATTKPLETNNKIIDPLLIINHPMNSPSIIDSVVKNKENKVNKRSQNKLPTIKPQVSPLNDLSVDSSIKLGPLVNTNNKEPMVALKKIKPAFHSIQSPVLNDIIEKQQQILDKKINKSCKKQSSVDENETKIQQQQQQQEKQPQQQHPEKHPHQQQSEMQPQQQRMLSNECVKLTPKMSILPSNKGLSRSTPRRRNHVRVLDFTTPSKTIDSSLRKVNTSPKALSNKRFHDKNLTDNDNDTDNLTSPRSTRRRNFKIRGNLFKKSPSLKNIQNITINQEENKKENVEKTNISFKDDPNIIIAATIATRSPATPLSGAWDKVTGIGSMLLSNSSAQSSPIDKLPTPIKVSSTRSWDADLRALCGTQNNSTNNTNSKSTSKTSNKNKNASKNIKKNKISKIPKHTKKKNEAKLIEEALNDDDKKKKVSNYKKRINPSVKNSKNEIIQENELNVINSDDKTKEIVTAIGESETISNILKYETKKEEDNIISSNNINKSENIPYPSNADGSNNDDNDKDNKITINKEHPNLINNTNDNNIINKENLNSILNIDDNINNKSLLTFSKDCLISIDDEKEKQEQMKNTNINDENIDIINKKNENINTNSTLSNDNVELLFNNNVLQNEKETKNQEPLTSSSSDSSGSSSSDSDSSDDDDNDDDHDNNSKDNPPTQYVDASSKEIPSNSSTLSVETPIKGHLSPEPNTTNKRVFIPMTPRVLTPMKITISTPLHKQSIGSFTTYSSNFSHIQTPLFPPTPTITTTPTSDSENYLKYDNSAGSSYYKPNLTPEQQIDFKLPSTDSLVKTLIGVCSNLETEINSSNYISENSSENNLILYNQKDDLEQKRLRTCEKLKEIEKCANNSNKNNSNINTKKIKRRSLNLLNKTIKNRNSINKYNQKKKIIKKTPIKQKKPVNNKKNTQNNKNQLKKNISQDNNDNTEVKHTTETMNSLGLELTETEDSNDSCNKNEEKNATLISNKKGLKRVQKSSPSLSKSNSSLSKITTKSKDKPEKLKNKNKKGNIQNVVEKLVEKQKAKELIINEQNENKIDLKNNQTQIIEKIIINDIETEIPLEKKINKDNDQPTFIITYQGLGLKKNNKNLNIFDASYEYEVILDGDDDNDHKNNAGIKMDEIKIVNTISPFINLLCIHPQDINEEADEKINNDNEKTSIDNELSTPNENKNLPPKKRKSSNEDLKNDKKICQNPTQLLKGIDVDKFLDNIHGEGEKNDG